MTTSTFYGREEELKWLRGLWDQATHPESGGPRMAFIIADTGIGKTRLAHALYQNLTNDPAWDPPGANYWPETFQAPGVKMIENPDLVGHIPKGPPKFLWLGMRWQVPEGHCTEGNCPIPESRAALSGHVKIVEQYMSAWEHLYSSSARVLRREGWQEGMQESILKGVEYAVELAIPLAGLFVKLGKAAGAVAKERAAPQLSALEHQEKELEDAADEMVNLVRGVFGNTITGGIGLPLVLLLDDAQWIDKTSLKFINKLWAEAERKNWKLLVIVTHWEREWCEKKLLPNEKQAKSMLQFLGKTGVESRNLEPATDNSLRALLQSNIPGLTPAQHELIIGKAHGNFLTMVENISDLLKQPECFVHEDLRRPLSPTGVKFVEKWEPSRQKRVEQRFRDLEPPVLKKILGWSSRLGLRFLQGVVADFATKHHCQGDKLLSACVDPYSILGVPSPQLREFRDRAYHSVSVEYFNDFCADAEEPLLKTLRKHLVEWINRSFDDKGNLLETDAEGASTAPADSLSALDPNERRYFLDLAFSELKLASEPDWTCPETQAALRGICLFVLMSAVNRLWDEVIEGENLLVEVDWSAVPLSTVSSLLRESVADGVCDSGSFTLRQLVLVDLLFRAETLAEKTPSAENELDFARISNNLATHYNGQGRYDEAEPLYNRALAIWEKALGPEHPNVANSLNNLAGLYCDQGRYTEAEPLYNRALAIWEKAREPEHPDVATCLNNLATLYCDQGCFTKAKPLYERALAIREKAFGPEHPNAANSLNNLATLYSDQSRYDVSEPLYNRALAIREKALGPEHPDVATSLNNLAMNYSDQSRYDVSEPLYNRALAIREKALGPEHPSVAHSLNSLAVLYRNQGRHDEAEPLLKRALAIWENLEPEHPNVAVILDNLARLYCGQGRYNESEPLLKLALAIREKALGPEHFYVVRSLNSLATLYHGQGRYDDAEPLYRRALAIWEKAFGPEHPDVIRYLEFLSEFYGEIGDTAKQKEYAERAQSGKTAGNA